MGLLAVFTNFKPMALKEKASNLLVNGPNGSVAKEIAETSDVIGANEVPEPNEPGGAQSEVPLLSSTGKSMIWKARRYVLIHNKWVIERADSVYMIDGMRTFFKDSGRFVKGGAATQARAQAKAESPAPTHKRGSKAQELLQRISANPLSAYSPETIKDLSEALSDAKASISERDKVLDELAK